MKIWVDKNYLGCYFVLFLAFANDSFRFTSSGLTSFYRLVSPFLIFLLLFKGISIYFNVFKVFFMFMVYSLLTSLIYYGQIQYEYYLFAGYLLIEYIIIRYLKEKMGKTFTVNFYRFLDKIGIFLIIAGFFQMIYRFTFPFVKLPVEHGINLFFSNENELAAPLAALGIIYIFTFYFMKKKQDGIKFICAFFILFINDAKLSIIGVALALIILFFAFLFSKRCLRREMTGKLKTCLIMMIVLAIIFFLTFFEIEFWFRDYKINLGELIVNSWKAIIQGKTISKGGSIADRTDAIIYALLELKNSWFLGIGWGNSVYMLTLPQYTLLTAKSMHNILAQFLCEFGFLAILAYTYVLGRLFFHIKKANKNWISFLKVVYAISFIFISSQSSIGILSNYMLWAITIYIIFIDNNENIYPNDINKNR
ncbi:O-antigen ligase domain-containing protein [Clostridiaceae bacterium]|nr:O-antigen ligase domain-containing protein [Clostridiaceae bacterium]RKI08579.1 O-antigen ligase domain-containing protein [bacterium 1XD21-70]